MLVRLSRLERGNDIGDRLMRIGLAATAKARKRVVRMVVGNISKKSSQLLYIFLEDAPRELFSRKTSGRKIRLLDDKVVTRI